MGIVRELPPNKAYLGFHTSAYVWKAHRISATALILSSLRRAPSAGHDPKPIACIVTAAGCLGEDIHIPPPSPLGVRPAVRFRLPHGPHQREIGSCMLIYDGTTGDNHSASSLKEDPVYEIPWQRDTSLTERSHGPMEGSPVQHHTRHPIEPLRPITGDTVGRPVRWLARNRPSDR